MVLKFLILILTLCIFNIKGAPSVPGCGTNNSDYEYNTRSGSCYKFHQNTLTWQDAYNKCKDEDAYLAIVNNKIESSVLKNLYPKAYGIQEAWAGVRNLADRKGWVTIQGQTLSEAGFEEWKLGHPTYTGTMYCAAFDKDGSYDNFFCHNKFPFICEKAPELVTQ